MIEQNHVDFTFFLTQTQESDASIEPLLPSSTQQQTGTQHSTQLEW